MKKKVHLKGIPCKTGSHWKSVILTSNPDPSKCTCYRCLKCLNSKRNRKLYYVKSTTT